MSAHEYRYPDRKVIKAIQSELKGSERVFPTKLVQSTELISKYSSQLERLQTIEGFPRHQIRRCVWIGSQYRLAVNSEDPNLKIAGSAILYLIGSLERKDSLDSESRSQLNWVIDNTVLQLSNALENEDIRSHLSSAERSAIYRRLGLYRDHPPSDKLVLFNKVEKQTEAIVSVSNQGHMWSMADKISALIETSRSGPTELASIATVALQYLEDEDDIVPDTAGILGLLDDIFVIEWAYAAVEGQTIWLPLLEDMLSDWPFVGDLVVDPANDAPAIGRYSQYIVCASLTCLFRSENKSLLIIRESGPFPLLATYASAMLISQRKSANRPDNEDRFPIGQHIFVGDEIDNFPVEYGGKGEIAGELRHKLRVRDAGTIYVDQSTIDSAWHSTRNHRQLAKGNSIKEWEKSGHVSVMSTQPALKGTFDEDSEAILLLTSRKKLDNFLGYFSPQGATLADLFGMQYFTSSGHLQGAGTSSNKEPLIYACSDPSRALELLKSPPDTIAVWRVIVDGASLANQLEALISSTRETIRHHICVFSELHDREKIRDLAKSGFYEWFLEDHHVQAPPFQDLSPVSSTNPITRFLDRQRRHWTTTRELHLVEDNTVTGIATGLAAVNDDKDTDNVEEMNLRFEMSRYVKRIIEVPINYGRIWNDSLQQDSLRLKESARYMSSFSSLADLLQGCISKTASNYSYNQIKEVKLLELASTQTHQNDPLLVLCASERAAARCKEAKVSNSDYENIDWITIQNLREIAPVKRLVVANWLGKELMREIECNGYADQLDVLLYPFEQKWFNSTTSANLKWQHWLEEKSYERNAQTEVRYAGRAHRSDSMWKEMVKRNLESKYVAITATEKFPDEMPTELDSLRNLILDSLEGMERNFHDSTQLVKSRLIEFEDLGIVGFFRPRTRVIVLSELKKAIAEKQKNSDTPNHEKMLRFAVEDLLPGQLIALPMQTDRDLIDERADRFLTSAPLIRKTANLWKTYLRLYFEQTGIDYETFASRLEEVGEGRSVQTIRSWTHNSLSIAPRNHMQTLTKIARITNQSKFREDLPRILESIASIYHARSLAAADLVKRITSGQIDLNARFLDVETSDSTHQFQLHRIKRIGDLHDVPTDLVGRVIDSEEILSLGRGG